MALSHRSADGSLPEAADHPELRKLKKRQGKLSNADCDAVRQLSLTVPTTAAGAVALLRYIAEQDDELLSLPLNDSDEDENMACSRALLGSLRQAFEQFAATGVA